MRVDPQEHRVEFLERLRACLGQDATIADAVRFVRNGHTEEDDRHEADERAAARAGVAMGSPAEEVCDE